MARELQTEDPYKFLKAYTHGLQEYIEAVSFLFYLRDGSLISLEEICRRLQFNVQVSTSIIIGVDVVLMVSLFCSKNIYFDVISHSNNNIF